MRRLNLFIAVLLSGTVIASFSSAEDYRISWYPSGYGGGGRFTSIAIDPLNPRTVYVGSDVAGIFRSRDSGNHFEIIGKGLEGFSVADIAITHTDPIQVFLLTDDGLYHSINQGDTWTRLSGKICYLSRYFGSHLMLITRNSLWVGTDKNGVYQISLSDSNVVTNHVKGLEHTKVNGLAVFDGYLYAGTSRGVFRLEKQNWKSQHEGALQGSAEVMDIASSHDVLYALEKHTGLFRWNEMSHTWDNCSVSMRSRPKGFKSLAVHPDNPDIVFIGSYPENWPYQLFKTHDGGKTWQSNMSFQIDTEAPSNWTQTLSSAENIAFVPGDSNAMFLADWWNLWKSTDTGEHWKQKHLGLQNTVINDLKIHPLDSKKLYLCAADNGLMISDDFGKHWRRAMNGVADGHAQAIEISQKDPSRMVLLVNPWNNKGRVYIYASRNSGDSWKDIGFSVPVQNLPKLGYVDGLATNLVLDTVSENTIYVGTNGYGVYKSVNAGKNWTQMNQGMTTPYIKGPGALRIHPQRSSTLFASTAAGGIFKTTNGGDNWQQVTTGKRFTFGLSIDPFNPAHIVAGCAGNKLLITYDEGKNWQETYLPASESPELAVFSVAFHPQRRDLVLAGTIRYDGKATEGLFISTNGAKSFQKTPMDIPKININSISWLSGTPLAGYIGFNGIGIFRVELGEAL